MAITYEQAKQYYLAERVELYQATSEQIDRLCYELETDQPLMHWHQCNEEIDALYEDALAEFC